MTQWGFLLLCVYITLGVGRATWRQAGVIAFGITAVVVTIALISYSRHTPTDKYYRSVDATVYSTGVTGDLPTSPNAEDVTGVVPASPANTVNNTNAGGQATGGGS